MLNHLFEYCAEPVINDFLLRVIEFLVIHVSLCFITGLIYRL